jgi:hypothetical protein
VWLDLPDPATTREQFRAAADRETDALRELLGALAAIDPNAEGLKAAEILKHSAANESLEAALAEVCGAKGDRLTARLIGSRFASLRGRIVGNRCLGDRELASGFKGWCVTTASA